MRAKIRLALVLSQVASSANQVHLLASIAFDQMPDSDVAMKDQESNEKNLIVTDLTNANSLARAEATPILAREKAESLIPPTPVAVKERIFSLDVIRGAALLGILAVNIDNFAAPEAWHDIPIGTPIVAFPGPHAPLHLIILMLKWTFFEGKMNFLFCMLFGAAVVLMTTRAQQRGAGQQIADIYLRRNLWLALFGLLHGLFIWSGDVLFQYGLVGVLILYPCRKLKAATLFITGTCISVPVVTIALFFWLGATNDFNLSRQAAVADARERAGQPLTPEQTQARRDWTARVESQKVTRQSIDSSMAVVHEPYLAGVLGRVGNYLGPRAALTHFTFGLVTLGAMLIGMALFKSGFLTAEKSYATYIWTAALGFLVATPLYIIGIWKAYTNGFSVLSLDQWLALPYYLNREAGGLAVLSTILLVVKSGVFRTFQSMLAAVGRTALSNYLLTSILCQFLFLWGPLKLYGKLDYCEYNYVVLAIWMINLIGSTLWLRAFRFGPTEWVWRSLTYQKLQPMRINSSVPTS
jgi:uncharacterized protein